MVEKSHPLLKLSQFRGVDIKPRNGFFRPIAAKANFKTMYIFQNKIRFYTKVIKKLSKGYFLKLELLRHFNNSKNLHILQMCDGI